MTIERDDPGSEKRSTETDPAAARGREDDDDHSLWAISVVGAALLQHGLTASEVETIVRDALSDYANFRKSVANPRMFLVARMTAKAKLHMKLRGVKAASDPEERVPHLLDVIRTKEALELLSEKERAALRSLFHEKKSYEDVAIELDVSVAYARRLVLKAITKLRSWRPPRTPWDEGR